MTSIECGSKVSAPAVPAQRSTVSARAGAARRPARDAAVPARRTRRVVVGVTAAFQLSCIRQDGPVFGGRQPRSIHARPILSRPKRSLRAQEALKAGNGSTEPYLSVAQVYLH